MAKVKPTYEVNDEFNNMAIKIVEKYPAKFSHVPVNKICCVNINNSSNKEKETKLRERYWKVKGVTLPMSLHCPYLWYVIIPENRWEEMDEKHKLATVADCLHSIPFELENEGKVNSCDTKGYMSVFATLGLDFENDPNIPHLLKDEVNWK